MIQARVTLVRKDEWRDVEVDDSVMAASNEDRAKAAVEAYWKTCHMRHMEYLLQPLDAVRATFEGGVFSTYVDNNRTYIALDLSKAGGPW